MFVFLFICYMLTPATMIGFGYLFLHKPPRTINMGFGYRTSMSMKNKDTWITAHLYAGKAWFYPGILLGIGSALCLFLIRKRTDFEDASLWIMGVQMAVLCSAIPYTEIKLKKLFDKDGRRK